MLWKLRMFWDRLEPAALVFFAVVALVIGGLAAAMFEVFADRDARAARERQLHANSLACLARNVYFEARGEPLAGQYAVAEVTLNRRGWGPFSMTVCEVVYAPGAFSWTAQRRLPDPAGPAWETAQQVAEAVYSHRHVPTVHGARYYHAVYVKPDWAREKRRVGRIGNHIFYR